MRGSLAACLKLVSLCDRKIIEHIVRNQRIMTAPDNALAKVCLPKQVGAENLAALRLLNYLLSISDKNHNASAR